MIVIPESILKKLVDYSLKNVTFEYLEKIFKDVPSLGDYNFLDNAKALLLPKSTSSRKIESHLFFNRERCLLPTVHIGLPSEQIGLGNGLGFDPSDEEDGVEYINYHTRSFSSRYKIIFTSNNTFEVLIMYIFFRSVFIGNVHLLEMNGLYNPKFSGGDIVLTDYLIPAEIYSRALFIDCNYDFTAPSLINSDKITNIKQRIQI